MPETRTPFTDQRCPNCGCGPEDYPGGGALRLDLGTARVACCECDAEWTLTELSEALREQAIQLEQAAACCLRLQAALTGEGK